MRPVILTHIDTGGHGYVSAPKTLIKSLGLVKRISQYSGLTFNRVYLEEDSDATLLIEAMKAKGIPYEIKSGYNLKFAIHHNYSASLFDYIPRSGDMIISGDNHYKIVAMGKRIVIQSITLGKFSIPYTNPFKYIDSYYRLEGIERLRAGLEREGIIRSADHLISNWKLTGDESLGDVLREFKEYIEETV